MTRPAGILLAVAGAVALLAIAVLAAGAPIAGGAILSLTGVLAVAAVFYVVGDSEDRDRRRHPHG